jgi:hypothetical protein
MLMMQNNIEITNRQAQIPLIYWAFVKCCSILKGTVPLPRTVFIGI